MRKYITILFLVIGQMSMAQGDKDISNADFKERLYFGGGLGGQFTSNVTSFELSPIVGYLVTNSFSAGVGITYIYYKLKVDRGNDFRTDIYGYKLFLRQNFLDKFYATTEFENLSLEYFNDGSPKREWIPGLFIGGGYFEPIGRNAGFNIAALYNLLYDEDKSPYNSPLVLRIGFTLGF